MVFNQADYLFVIYNKLTGWYEIGLLVTDEEGNSYYITRNNELAINEGIVVSVFKDEMGIGL